MPLRQTERRAVVHEMADAPAPVKQGPVPHQVDLEAAFNHFWTTLTDRMKRAPPAKLPRVREQTRGGTRSKRSPKCKPPSGSAKCNTLFLPGSRATWEIPPMHQPHKQRRPTHRHLPQHSIAPCKFLNGWNLDSGRLQVHGNMMWEQAWCMGNASLLKRSMAHDCGQYTCGRWAHSQGIG
ncbi:Hypothetical predicted protein [Pelobates cultripes]|uniref:Uncharacterized protein n=1 Tax=Pelobates cultripes TaxID=61616 RepID=A0AAD1WV23_PELCU|nr:Hypothetical predicted protein [Pelobates cultripes]